MDDGPNEKYAINKTEASNFQASIKRFSEQCVTAQRSCSESRANAKKSEELCITVSKDVRDTVQSSKRNMNRAMESYRKHDEACNRNRTDVKKMHSEINEQYEKVLFTATNGRDLLESSLEVMSAATETLSVCN